MVAIIDPEGQAQQRPRMLPDELRDRVRALVLAEERILPVGGSLGAVLPRGGLPRGAVVAVGGAPGVGASTLVLHLLAAATSKDEWVGAIDPEAVLGGLAAFEAGIDLTRLAVVRRVPRKEWSRAVAVLLDGLSVVAARVPTGLSTGEARRLLARARERRSILLATGAWPIEAALRLQAEGSGWVGLGRGTGLLGERALRVRVVGRGAAVRERVGEVALPGRARAS
ncbi:MAG: hypothetical protein ACRDV9_09745 [Acidimicrobiia bacterium]